MSFLSEQDLLFFMDRFFPAQHKNILLGRGDDCALLNCPAEICLSTDIFMENVHFKTSYFSAADIGYKALAINLSDIAAMGAEPLGFALNLMFPRDLNKAFFQEMFAAMSGLAQEYDLPLVGGDLSSAACLGLDITIWGQSTNGFLTRRKCKPGDLLFIIGEIGLARVGLQILEKKGKTALPEFSSSIMAHLRPRMHVHKARLLARQSRVRGLMDVSDGLVRDLPRFTGPDLGVDISLTSQDLHPEVLKFTAEQGLDPLEFALTGGEDYALLGAVPEREIEHLQTIIPDLKPIGRVLSSPGLFIHNQLVKLSGFDHFQENRP